MAQGRMDKILFVRNKWYEKYLRNLGVDGKIILNLILVKRDVKM